MKYAKMEYLYSKFFIFLYKKSLLSQEKAFVFISFYDYLLFFCRKTRRKS